MTLVSPTAAKQLSNAAYPFLLVCIHVSPIFPDLVEVWKKKLCCLALSRHLSVPRLFAAQSMPGFMHEIVSHALPRSGNVRDAAVVNIPDGADHISAAGTSPLKGPRIPSFTASDGSRRRRKPFKSNSNHSLKGLHSQMLSHSHDPARSVHFGGGVMNTGSDLVGSQNSQGHLGLSSSAPHEGSAQMNDHTSEFSSSPPLYSLHGGALHNGHMDGEYDDSSPRSIPVTGAYDDGSPRGGEHHVMFDDGVSSVAESVETYATTSSNTGPGGVPREQKHLIRPDSHN